MYLIEWYKCQWTLPSQNYNFDHCCVALWFHWVPLIWICFQMEGKVVLRSHVAELIPAPLWILWDYGLMVLMFKFKVS